MLSEAPPRCSHLVNENESQKNCLFGRARIGPNTFEPPLPFFALLPLLPSPPPLWPPGIGEKVFLLTCLPRPRPKFYVFEPAINLPWRIDFGAARNAPCPKPASFEFATSFFSTEPEGPPGNQIREKTRPPSLFNRLPQPVFQLRGRGKDFWASEEQGGA